MIYFIILIIVLGLIISTTIGIVISCNNNNNNNINCTITFDVDGGVEVESIIVKKNSEIGELPTTSKENYEFIGWSDVKNGDVNINEKYIVIKDITLFAIFQNAQEEFCTITYFTSGTPVKSTTVKKGDTIGSLPFTDKQGCSFLGWFFDKDLIYPVFTEDVITNDVTLYAGFEEQDVDSILPEYTELSINSYSNDYDIKFESEEIITEKNMNSFISVTALYGELPKMSILPQENNKYILSAIGGYKNGGVYKITITDDRVNFVELNMTHNDDYTNDKTIKTIYLSINASNEEDVSVKDGVVELNYSSVTFSDTENKFIVTKAVYNSLPSDVSVVRIIGESNKDNRYIKITDIQNINDEYEFSFIDCDSVDDVYEDFNLNVSNISVSNDMTLPENQSTTNDILASVVKEMYTSKGTEAITTMLAKALNESPTLKAVLTASENPYKDNITDVTGKTFTIKGLLEDLEIKVSLGTARNSNFNGIGISPFDDTKWSMLAIEFNYETDIKNNVKLEATITITQYIYIGLATSANKSTGNFKAEITPYSQTDIDFKVLVCSISQEDENKGDNKKEEKKDISVEIENLTNGEGDSSNIIKDVQEMLENKGEAIRLCEVPMFTASYIVGGVLSINIDLNFVINVSFAAGIKINATLLEATTIGITGNYKTRTIDCYRRSAMGSDRYIFDFYAYGYLGVEAGISGEFSVSFIGLKELLKAGVGLEVGAYADLYGYLHYHAEERRVFKDIDTNGRHFQTLEGGMYFESGIYIKLSAFVDVGKKKYDISKEFKFKLLEAGDKYLYVEASENKDLVIVFNENDDNSLNLDDLIPAEGKFMDITTGEIETRIIPSKNIKIISNTNLFRVDNDKKLLTANTDKIETRILYGIPYGTISLYYKGANILFSSVYLNENIPQLKGFKELCKVTVVYLPKGTELDEATEFGKELTITYKVKSELGEQVVKTETVVAGQYYKGEIPFEIISYCRKNGLLSEIDGNVVTYNGFTSGRHILTEDTTFVFNTVEAQRFIAVKYKSQEDFASSEDVWTVDIMAMNYNELPTILQEQKYTPENIYFEYFVITPDGNKKVMGNEYLSKYDLYMRGTYGNEVGKVLATVKGSNEKINNIFAEMNEGKGVLKDYSEFFTFTLKAEYITGVQKVYFYAPNGDYGEDNVRYGESYKVPNYWINNINQSTTEKLVGWDIDEDGESDIEPNEQFVVTKDMILRPVMVKISYTITIIDLEGNETKYIVKAGEKIPENITNIINTDLGAYPPPSENSFYTQNQWRIVTTDFVAGDNGSAYFGNVSFLYNGDITVMPSCDMTFTGVKGELYHYVTIIDKTEGYFTYKNEDGEIVETKILKIAVKDGGVLGTSKDYNAKEFKYHAPSGVTSYSPSYTDENNEMLDFYGTIITKGVTYYLTIFIICS